jgi:hypothetical protein
MGKGQSYTHEHKMTLQFSLPLDLQRQGMATPCLDGLLGF